MRRVLVTLGIVVVAIALVGYCNQSNAQQPPEDPRIPIYRELLMNANDTIARLGAQAQGFAQQLKAAQDELAKLKAEPKKE